MHAIDGVLSALFWMVGLRFLIELYSNQSVFVYDKREQRLSFTSEENRFALGMSRGKQIEVGFL